MITDQHPAFKSDDTYIPALRNVPWDITVSTRRLSTPGTRGVGDGYRYRGSMAEASLSLITLSARQGNYFLARLPDDHVCCWDLIFTDGNIERDTSAAAIAVCGLLETARQMPVARASSPGRKPLC